MTPMVYTYLVYLVISISVTIWVAGSLHRNGRVFLIDSFHGNESLADSINHLLVVGFYLINVGFVTVTLRLGTAAHSVQESIEYLSTKIGAVLLILGVMHFFNVFLFSWLRKRSLKNYVPEVIPLGKDERLPAFMDRRSAPASLAQDD